MRIKRIARAASSNVASANKIHAIAGESSAVVRFNPLFDPATCDGYVGISDDDAIDVARQLARREGVFAGFSTGANVAAALQIAREMRAGETVVTTANDSGLKYLSTDLFE